MSKARYTVTGPCEIAGKAPGEVVQLDDAEFNIPALIDAGHITPAKATKATEKGEG